MADGGYLTVVAKGQRAVKNVETERKLVGIGMDCGFGGKNTDQVLEVLAKHNTNITFFMTGYPSACWRRAMKSATTRTRIRS